MRSNYIKGLCIAFILVLCISLLGCQVENKSVDKDSSSTGIDNDDAGKDYSLEGDIKGSTQENSQKENNTVPQEIIKITLQGDIFTTELTRPHSVCFDSLGSMYVADAERLKRINFNKEIETFAEFSQRCMTAITDSSNNIYVVTVHELYKINQEGEKLLLADGFVRADGLEIDAQGNIYVADAFANIIYKITPSNEKSIFIDNDLENVKPDTYYVTGLCFDSEYNNLYIVKHYDCKVMKYPIDSSGAAEEGKVYCDLASYRRPDYIAMDEEGNLYVTIFYHNKLLRIKPDLALDEIEINGAILKNPTGLAFGKNGFLEDSLYIANYKSRSILQVDIGIREQKR